MIRDLIIILVILAIIVPIGVYIYKSKKIGKKCIGCPYAKECAKNKCDR